MLTSGSARSEQERDTLCRTSNREGSEKYEDDDGTSRMRQVRPHHFDLEVEGSSTPDLAQAFALERRHPDKGSGRTRAADTHLGLYFVEEKRFFWKMEERDVLRCHIKRQNIDGVCFFRGIRHVTTRCLLP
ncbi:hypothetical protein TGRH88_077670 [Toxoplasma gondii]|uniref:Uncharacterized protein n=1 Tax=Toxoplasma gondii TaxID=5811 RepID=A0A7J6K3A0_TOXGO|nr:hypothetical protein TGRH88_077670 [Toxoplasma gondii]